MADTKRTNLLLMYLVISQVLRPIPTPQPLDQNKFTVFAFQAVGLNKLAVPSLGTHEFEIPVNHQIAVKEGDAIGFFSSDPVSILFFKKFLLVVSGAIQALFFLIGFLFLTNRGVYHGVMVDLQLSIAMVNPGTMRFVCFI
jgi:hypothetical protein